MIIKVLFDDNNKNDNIIMFNDTEIASTIYNARSNKDLDELANSFALFLRSFKDETPEFANRINELINEQRNYINNSNSMNNGLGGKRYTKTSTTPGVGVRRVSHSSSQVNDNQGFIRIKVLIVCSIMVTLVMYGILIITNLKYNY